VIPAPLTQHEVTRAQTLLAALEALVARMSAEGVPHPARTLRAALVLDADGLKLAYEAPLLLPHVPPAILRWAGEVHVLCITHSLQDGVDVRKLIARLLDVVALFA
jgi:hypothetical protein